MVLLDLLTSVAENSQDESVRLSFEAWRTELHNPPAIDWDDLDTLTAAVWAAYLDKWDELSRMHQAGVGFSVEGEQAPPGWDNATLLAEMQAAARPD